MRLLQIIFVCILFSVPQVSLKAQFETGTALEGIVVEKYFEVKKPFRKKSRDTAPTPGMVTYRIFVDMKPGCALVAVYGNEAHPLRISTTTFFYNHTKYGAETGDQVAGDRLTEDGVALDSWLTMGMSGKNHVGVPLEDDRDGSILSLKGINDRDGLIDGRGSDLITYGLDLINFRDNRGVSFYTDNGAWAAFRGISGPTPENRVLIAQLTTDGDFSFELNLVIATPDCDVTERYVAVSPAGDEIQSDFLIFPRPDSHQTD